MSLRTRVTILGCGSSGGVPRVGGDWGACDPADPRNRRRRCSMLIERWRTRLDEGAATTVLIDTAPDFREQALDAGIARLDAILFTHDHADQTHGIDDVRAIVQRQRARIPAFMEPSTWRSLEPRFGYIFSGVHGYPALLERQPLVTPLTPFEVDGPGGSIRFTPFAQDHGGVSSTGFRLDDFAYANDVVALPEESLQALAGVSVFVVDALRHTPHPSHATVTQALAWIARLQPQRSILTNLHIDLDYTALAASLPRGVEPAFDGLRLEF
jgi:phosphoribosyl 1,2-cyclic phosphate phosphodiesterase